MRRIVVTLTENPDRHEVEMFIEVESGTGSEMENAAAEHFMPRIIQACSVGAKAIVTGYDSRERLADAARIDVDIRKAGL